MLCRPCAFLLRTSYFVHLPHVFELEQPSIQEQFESVIQTEDKLQIRDFLNHQNISDVADLVYEFPDYESQIIANMSVHRAASVFKILEFPTQKRIIQTCHPIQSQICSMNFPPMTVPIFWKNCPAMRCTGTDQTSWTRRKKDHPILIGLSGK